MQIPSIVRIIKMVKTSSQMNVVVETKLQNNLQFTQIIRKLIT